MRIKLFFLSILLSLLGTFSLPLYADNNFNTQSPQIITAAHQLAIESTRNILLANKLAALQQQITNNTHNSISPDLLKRVALTVSLAKTDLDSVNLAIAAVQEELEVIQDDVNTLSNTLRSALPGANPSGEQQNSLTDQLNIQQHLHKIQQQRIHVLQQTLQLAQQTLQVAEQWQTQLQTRYQQQQQQQRQQALDQLALTLQQEQQSWLQRLSELNKQLQTNGSYGLLNSATYINLEIGILEAEERSNLTQTQLEIVKIHNNLENLDITPNQQYSLGSLNSFKRQTDTIVDQLTDIQAILQNKIHLLQKRSQIILTGLQNGIIEGSDGNNNLSTLYSLNASYQKQLKDTQGLIQQTQKVQTNITHQLNRQIASRQSLPGIDKQAWLLLGQHLLETPGLTLQALQNAAKPLITAINTANLWQQAGWLLYFIGWGTAWYWLRRTLIIGTYRFEKRKQSVLTSNLFLVCLRLLKRHLAGALLLVVLISLPLVLDIPVQSFSLMISAVIIIFGFSLAIGFARIILLENTADKSGHDVQLYYRLKWALITGGFITAITILMHQLPVTFGLLDLIDRLFMLFLLAVALVLLRAWKIVPDLLKPYLEDKRPYLKQVVRWLSLLIPLTILSNALVGLIGYVILAWSIAAYQSLFLIVLTGYILVRGILGELMNFIAAKTIRHLKNGWLWSEALLKPLHQILKIGVFIGAVVVLFNLYGWGSQSWAVTKLTELFNLRLFALAGSGITPFSILEAIFLIAALKWAARWTREFSYRWLFARTKDLGLRNSLAIFSQYSVVIIGILVALKVIGINLTALTVVASAFALGVGWGLRDLANNFACGVLLLIERPVHVGDYVTMANLDGEVLHVGMRAITVTTDDHQELVVPNSVVFTQPFINWTHRDNIVRVPITIKTTRTDDPHRVKDIILDVLKSTPKILTNPPPNVFLKELAEVLLKFEVEYYVDLRAIPSRVSVRSQFLLALWDRFQAEGIHAPEYPHEIVLLNQNHFASPAGEADA